MFTFPSTFWSSSAPALTPGNTGWVQLTTWSDDPIVGFKTWSSPANAKTSNNLRSSLTFFFVSFWSFTHLLKGLGLVGAPLVPSGALITGVEARREGLVSNTVVQDAFMRLVKGGVIQSTNASGYPQPWSTFFDTTVFYGSSSDLWGTTLTDVDVNASNFGLAIGAKAPPFTFANVNVDQLMMKIHYLS